MVLRLHAGAERRKQSILQAARILLQAEPLSMRRLAEAAGVSQATPYNLFGTKRRLYVALHRELETELIESVAATESRDALDRMYSAIRLMAARMEREAGLYRELFATIYASDAEDHDAQVETATAFWDGLLLPLHAEDLLSSDTDMPAFTRNFVYLLSGALMAWTDRRIDTAALESAVRYGFTLAALALATDRSRDRLLRVLATS
ncbi:TetR/AcrR family transcriptional regulator [Rhizorhabdus sp. FW153]|uniref:TetR/AcrR family transcriptional regulator n=1 Tax=Rhizorhabdus sp. FW153 TaxID=3400216 RepID=UPI003CF9A993